MVDLATIASIALFRDLNADARRVLAERGMVRRYPRGALLWNVGDRPSGLHVLVAGEVRVVRIVGGRQHVLHTEQAGGTLGDVPLFDGSTVPATAIASSACVCAVFTRDALAGAIAKDARLAFVLLGRLASRLRHVIDRLDGASARTVTERLARYLVNRLPRDGRSTSVGLGGTQTAVAEELGTVREVLVRALRDLRESGVIAADGRGRIRVCDVAELRRLARR
jgi:CRP/FNR family transcriptional regulator